MFGFTIISTKKLEALNSSLHCIKSDLQAKAEANLILLKDNISLKTRLEKLTPKHGEKGRFISKVKK